jgi:hypothetical protein
MNGSWLPVRVESRRGKKSLRRRITIGEIGNGRNLRYARYVVLIVAIGCSKKSPLGRVPEAYGCAV